jgi:methionine aminotransferase
MTDTAETFHTPTFPSRLPDTGITIFTRMSALAKQHNAVNLGQGFPDYDCGPTLISYVNEAMGQGLNQYPLMSGTLELREAITDKIAGQYGHHYDPHHEITVTAGATQALLCTILCCVKKGDEVIVIEPAYDSYIPAIKLAGGVAKPVPMQMHYNAEGVLERYLLPFDGIKAAMNKHTRLIIINTPHNPTGTVWHAADMLRLQEMLRDTEILICSDEVYEHMVYDGANHESVARYPELAARSFVISSFGKTFHVTGWKVGYVAAPPALTAEFRKLHQYSVFTVNTPMQHGIARYIREHPETYLGLPEFYQQKRDYFREKLQQSNFRLLPCEGAYFQSVDYSRLTIPQAKLKEAEFAEWMTEKLQLACIPMSAFYSTPHESHIVRFCFAKKQETLDKALAIIAKAFA